MRITINLPKEQVVKLQAVKNDIRVPFSQQIQLALEKYWERIEKEMEQ